MYLGQLVRLREFRTTDTVLAQRFLNDAEVRKFLADGIPYPYTFEDEQAFINDQSANKQEYNFAIETLDGEHFIGGCGINRVDWKNSVVEVGIFIGDKAYWGKGYGTDAMQVLIAFVFEQMNINKIKLTVYSFNKRAQRSYAKCGFKQEGVLREEIFRDGQVHDRIIMGLLRREYLESTS